jgi:carotenoid cleavage dioxygenase-like enzyme
MQNKELNYKINYNFSREESEIINKINGFYGLIGPDVNKSNVKTLYDLFTGDGVIQGLFIDNGNLTYINHFVKTDKLIYEDKHGKIPQNIFTLIFFMIMNKLNLLPNLMGMANTALLNVENNIYALFERDTPYLIDVNFKEKKVNTLKKVNLDSITHFSAHSKYNNEDKVIESIDYNIFKRRVDYYIMNNDFKIINSTSVYTEYMPIIHDFVNLPNSMIFVESPIESNIGFLKKNIKMSVFMNKLKNTKVHIINKSDFSKKSINVPNSFYIFHYANFEENKSEIIIYASIYDLLDFSELNLVGKYRRIVIDKKTFNINIHKNNELENYNLDFPLKYENNVILRNIENNAINGFIICNGLEIKKKIFFEDKYLCGEPSIIEIDKNYFLASFGYDNNNAGFFIIIDLNSYKKIEIPLKSEINIGFHSIFIKNKI